MRVIYLLIVFYGLYFSLMFSFDTMGYIKNLTRIELLNSMITVVYAAIILTLPLVVMSMTGEKEK